MYQRPKLGETDEDLLKLQNDFFKDKKENKLKPAAKVIGPNNDENTKANPEKIDEEDTNLHSLIANTFEAIPSNITLGEIRAVSSCNNFSPIKAIDFSDRGFPQAKRRDVSTSSQSGSIFSQQMKKLKTDMQTETNVISQPGTSFIKTEKNIPRKSYILTGKDSNDLHKHNSDLMSTMTEAEILEERERLLSTLDPALIAFLKSKRYHEDQIMAKKVDEVIKVQNVDVNLEEIEATKEILETAKSDSWLHFDKIESNKLAWMANPDVKEVVQNKDYEARFDFDGFLLPYTMGGINETNRALHHHGEEPERPGYTLQELFQLCRSTVLQQKVISLTTIAHILRLNATGIYASLSPLPLEQLFFVLRFCLDDNCPALLLASSRAMAGLYHRQLDEQLLDNMLSFGYQVQPVLAVSVAEEEEDDETLNDQEVVEKDLVKVAVRSGLVARIRYIFQTPDQNTETIIYCLQILIRLARDSKFALKKISSEHNLLNLVVQKLQRNSNSDSDVVIHVLKFLRVLCCRNKPIAQRIITKYDVLGPLTYFLTNEFITSNSKGINIQVECFNLWNVFLYYKLGINQVSSIFGSVQKNLKYHIDNTNCDISTTYILQSHVAAIFNFISHLVIAEYQDFKLFLPLINMGIRKWMTQIIKIEEFKCGKLQIISSILNTVAIVSKLARKDLFENIDAYVLNIIASAAFTRITLEIHTGSNILNNFEANQKSANFITAEGAVWNNSEHAIPILQTNSCLPFLNALSNCICHLNNKQIMLKFLQHPNIVNYLTLLNHSSKFYFTANWFTRIESNLLLNILHMSVVIQKDLDSALFYELTVKSLPIYNNEQKGDVELLLKNIIFSPSYYPTDLLLENLQLGEDNTIFASCLTLNNDIFSMYSQVLGLTNDAKNLDTLSEDIKIGNILPVDWIYMPIMVLYSEQQNFKTTLTEIEQVHIVENCLKWVYIYEKYFPNLANLINPTDRYCRLACVYLGSDIFLLPELNVLLRKCLELLISNKVDELDFDKKIEGLTSFQDFYAQLLEQYQGVSYGDEVFSNFILVPLAQKHNVKLRKAIWSEYGMALDYFRIPQEKVICPPNMFLEPPETDLSLLKCYRNALIWKSLRPQSFLHTIAKHHVETYCANVRRNK